MKCFNHTGIEAVATCPKCGKGLCRECAEKYTPCMCDTCAAKIQQSKQEQARNRENQRKEKYKAALVDTRSEFIKTIVIGILVSIIATWWTAKDGKLSSFGDYANTIVAWFFVPFGWKFLTYLQSFFPISLFGTFWFWIIYIAVKAVLSIIVGIPAFIYQLVKTILAQRKINNLK
ncbi:MAG: hypothetical protein K2M60_02375 [Lachnospiraceae bacterium]|nr:hypothetical protein [Lachnospiraceae bacterium]MDE6252345.1 hypothetical protein [Lachnospiraceae bacterium]